LNSEQPLAFIIFPWIRKEAPMHKCEIRLSILGLLPALIPVSAIAQMTPGELPVNRADLCVTEGEIADGPNNRLTVDAEKMRAYVNAPTSQSEEARFTYVGPTAKESALGSGEIRRQFGLKLRAQNACNLVYAMWRFEPESKIVVSIKSNPGQRRSSECGNRGYQNVKPRRSVPIPALRPGDSHRLRAMIEGEELRVLVDNRVVWEGSLGPDAESLAGPVGIRSDNVRLALDLSAGAVAIRPDFRFTCKTGPDASD
jgi:hypothetical protein